MANLPVIILHGWSDTSNSFRSLAGWLQQNGFNVIDIYLGDYLSMNDEITLPDLGAAFGRALNAHNIPQTRFSFDAIVHSTGGLVIREYLRQVCSGNASRTPVKHLCMMAPANFGSPLARLGKSVLGRLFKGWSWDHFGQTGQKILNALELASPYSCELAEQDLFDPKFKIFDSRNTITTVLAGTAPYSDFMRSTVHENGSDGTVRVSTANLNAHYFTLDFGDITKPNFSPRPRNVAAIAFAVFDRDHTEIHDPNAKEQMELWQKTVLDALTIDSRDYRRHVTQCNNLTKKTLADGISGKNKEWFHQYQHVVFRVHDQFGEAIPDYVVEFYQEDDDPKDKVFNKVHSEILEKVTANSSDASYRSFLFDTTDLCKYLDSATEPDIQMSISAANISKRILYRNPVSGIAVFIGKNRDFLFPNEPVLVDVTLHREQAAEVFKLTKFS
jgi:pimeloyl-ACP methyl ester carboxylesterase